MEENPDQYYLELAEKWISGTITPEEMEAYARWYNEIDPHAVLEVPAEANDYRRRLLAKINERRHGAASVHRLSSFQRAGWVAAAMLILLAGGFYYYYKAPKDTQIPQAYTKPVQNDLPPGRNQAILTLAGGKTIILDSAANGILARQGNSRVQKLAAGRLSYLTTNKGPVQPDFNTLTTPRGGQYQLTLPDGTGVWLNAASSIRYPTAFVGKDRTVVISGEVYFEVAQDREKPFKVFVGSPSGTEVDVLGTHFNINAYGDEAAIKTTLLDGHIKVRGSGRATDLIEPGQQAQVFVDGSLVLARDVNMDEVMAWKNGLFEFDNADIRSVMRQLARWYDVEVSYEGQVTDDRFAGKLPRDASAEETLHILEKNQVHFRIEGKKIIVLP